MPDEEGAMRVLSDAKTTVIAALKDQRDRAIAERDAIKEHYDRMFDDFSDIKAERDEALALNGEWAKRCASTEKALAEAIARAEKAEMRTRQAESAWKAQSLDVVRLDDGVRELRANEVLHRVQLAEALARAEKAEAALSSHCDHPTFYELRSQVEKEQTQLAEAIKERDEALARAKKAEARLGDSEA